MAVAIFETLTCLSPFETTKELIYSSIFLDNFQRICSVINSVNDNTIIYVNQEEKHLTCTLQKYMGIISVLQSSESVLCIKNKSVLNWINFLIPLQLFWHKANLSEKYYHTCYSNNTVNVPVDNSIVYVLLQRKEESSTGKKVFFHLSLWTMQSVQG